MAGTLSHDAKILVLYPDTTSRETTVGELLDFFKEESKDWRQWFISNLAENGVANGRFAIYSVIKNNCPVS